MGHKINLLNMQKIVLALLIAAVSAKSVALSKVQSAQQLLDVAKIATDCEGSGTGSGSGDPSKCDPLTIDCLKVADGKASIDCATSTCKETATGMGKEMCNWPPKPRTQPSAARPSRAPSSPTAASSATTPPSSSSSLSS